MNVYDSISCETRTESVWRPFEEIASTYDRVNRVVSFGLDRLWRNFLVRRLKSIHCEKLLDLASGTGDVLLEAMRSRAVKELAVGADMSIEMLALAQRKTQCVSYGIPCLFVRGDALVQPFRKGTFDAITMAFGIRNVASLSECIESMCQVLRPGGRIFILEFSLPESRIVRAGYLVYLRHILPYVGGFISGNLRAYRYLNQSIEAFPYGEMFCRKIRDAGFVEVRATPLTFGVATLYEGKCPDTVLDDTG